MKKCINYYLKSFISSLSSFYIINALFEKLVIGKQTKLFGNNNFILLLL